MPSSSSTPRVVSYQDIKADKKLLTPAAALAVSPLGLGVAGSVALTGVAQHTTLTATVSTNDLPTNTSRGAERSRLDPAIVKSLADQRAELLSKIESQVTAASMDKSAAARARALEVVSDATRKQAVLLARGNSAPTNRLPSAQDANTSGCLPIPAAAVAARFGQVGPWAPTAPVGFSSPSAHRCAPQRASSNAGIGPASGWAGNYVAINARWHPHLDGSHVDRLGERWPTVSACQLVGAVGMTAELGPPRALRGLSGWGHTRRHLQRSQSGSLAERPRPEAVASSATRVFGSCSRGSGRSGLCRIG